MTMIDAVLLNGSQCIRFTGTPRPWPRPAWPKNVVHDEIRQHSYYGSGPTLPGRPLTADFRVCRHQP